MPRKMVRSARRSFSNRLMTIAFRTCLSTLRASRKSETIYARLGVVGGIPAQDFAFYLAKVDHNL